MNTMSDQRLSAWARTITLGAYVLLLLSITATRLLTPVGAWNTNLMIWLVQSVPLLIFLPGLWRGGITSYAWLTFVSLIYFTAAVTNVFIPERQLGAAVDVALTVILFSSALLFIRWRARALRAAAQP